jgi:hypothetical protein
MRPKLGPLLGAYTPGAGWYCIPCEYAILRANRTEITSHAREFVNRLSSRPVAP